MSFHSGGSPKMNEFDEAYENGRKAGMAGERKMLPCDEHAWTMFKSEAQKTRERKLNRSYEEGYEAGRRGR